jgi:hypothetical protein
MVTPVKPKILGPRLEFPADAFARLPTGAVADGLIKESVRNDDLVLTLDYPLPDPPEIGPSDLLQLLVDGNLVGDVVELQSYKPGDIINVTLHAKDRPLDNLVDRRVVNINYRVKYESGAGNFEDGPPGQTFITDIVRPGGDSLAALEFARDVQLVGVTPAALVTDGGGQRYLPCTVKGYADAAIGDWIFARIDDTEATVHELVDGQVNKDVEIRFPVELIEPFDGGTHAFTCRIVDRAGNVSVVSTAVPLRIRLSEQIDDLLPPRVPGAADGLVTDSDAHVNGGVAVEIPGHASIQEGDLIVLIWNAHEATGVRVDASDVGKDPLKVLTEAYGEVYDDWYAAAGDADQNVSATVTYRIERGGTPIGTPAQSLLAPVNLFGAGGKDPKPESPENENLLPPIVQAAGGGPPNIVPADAVNTDAMATIPGMTASVPSVAAFRPGDRLQFFWNGQPIDTEFVVLTSGADITRTIPAAVLAAHSPGSWNVHYTAARTLATPPFVNTAISPVQRVDVADASDLPGEGKPLAKAKWLEAWSDQEGVETIDYNDATSGSGTPVRIYGYTNMAEKDTVTMSFQGYTTPKPGGEPAPGSEYALKHTVVADDLIPKRDETVDPPVDAIFMDFLIPTANLLVIVFGSATLDYAARNTAGEVPAEQAWVYVSVRDP